MSQGIGLGAEEDWGPELEALFDEILAADVDNILDMPQRERRLTSEDRLLRGFLEIAEFYRMHGHRPSSDSMDISERRLGARLDGLHADDERLSLLQAQDDIDDYGLLEPEPAPASLDELLDSDAFNELFPDDDEEGSIYDLSTLPARTIDVEDVDRAEREQAEDFEKFEPLFVAKKEEVRSGAAELRPYTGIAMITEGRFFVVGGMLAFVAEVGETEERQGKGRLYRGERLRVIFANGTQSRLLRESFAKLLAKQEGSVVVPAGQEFVVEDFGDADDLAGSIYVLRSRSHDPQIMGLRDLHKIGFTTTPVEQRIRGAEHDPTFLMAPVDLVAEYEVYNMRPSALEHLLHRVFADVRLDLSQVGEDGQRSDPSEWFLVPLPAIDQAVRLIMSGDIVDFVYNRTTQELEYQPVEE